MEITWFNEKPKDLVITLTAGNITLNKPATTFFENAYSVMLGFDKEKGIIVIRPLNKEETMRHDIPEKSKYKITVRTSYSRVTNKAFMDTIGEMLNLNFNTEVHKYKANWDAKNHILVVNLKEEF